MQNFLELICLLHVIACAVFLGFNTENQSWLVITLMQKFLELICLFHVIACAVFFGELKSGNGFLKLYIYIYIYI